MPVLLMETRALGRLIRETSELQLVLLMERLAVAIPTYLLPQAIRLMSIVQLFRTH